MLAKNVRNRTDKSVNRARTLRKQMSVSEKVLWNYLRKERIGFKFRKQATVLDFILDFYCAEAKVCIEVDGEQHEDQREYDAYRDASLQRAGILTIRIPSLNIFEKSDKLATGSTKSIEPAQSAQE